MPTIKILVIAEPASIHTARWVNQFIGCPIELHIISGDTEGYGISADLHGGTVYTNEYYGGSHEVINEVIPLSTASEVRDALVRLHETVKFDFIHSLGMYVNEASRCDAIYAARLSNSQLAALPWLYSSWGMDLDVFAKDPANSEQCQSVIQNMDYYISETNRDIQYMRDFGFTGTILGKLPAFGGTTWPIIPATDILKRRKIIIKGRDKSDGDPIGCARQIMEALVAASSHLHDYEIIILQCGPTIKKIAELVRNSLGLNIQFPEKFELHEDVLQLYQEARLFIAMTTNDGLPSSLVEAMSCGVFPIHSDLSAVREYICHQQNGLLADASSVAGISDCIRIALTNDDLICKAAEYNQTFVRLHWTDRVVTEQSLAWYRQIAGKKKTESSLESDTNIPPTGEAELVCIERVSDVIPSIIATQWMRKQKRHHADKHIIPLICATQSGLAETADLAALVAELSRPFNWCAPKVLSKAVFTSLLSETSSSPRLPAWINAKAITSIYYSNCMPGSATELMLEACANAQRISFGESLSLCFDSQFAATILHGKEWREELALNVSKYKAETFATLLPTDYSGLALYGTELCTISRIFALDTIQQILDGLPEFNPYVGALVRQTQTPPYLCLVPGFAAHGFCSAKQEAEILYEIITRTIPPGSVVVLKSIEAAISSNLTFLLTQLKHRYQVFEINARFTNYPIELWGELICNSHLIGIGTSTVSLSYLFAKQIQGSLDAGLVKTFIRSHYHNYFEELELIKKHQQAELERWNGRGMLWRSEPRFGKPIERIQGESSLRPCFKDEYELASTIYRNGNFQQSLTYFERLVKEAPCVPVLQSSLAVNYWQLNRRVEGVSAMKTAYEYDPTNKSIEQTLAHMLNALHAN